MNLLQLKAYNNTIGNEGALSNNPADKGGLTWKGIAQNMHPNWAGWQLVKAHIAAKHNVSIMLKDTHLEALVQQFYEREFMNPLRLAEIKYEPAVIKLFDTAVNVGFLAAIKFQEVGVGLPETGKMSDSLINKLNELV